MPAKVFLVVFFSYCFAILGHAQKGIVPAIFLLADEIMLSSDSSFFAEAISSQPNLPANKSAIGSLPDYLKNKVVRWEKTGNHKVEVKGWFANGQLAVSAQMRKSVLHGKWASWYENGSKRDQGNFVNGKPDGHWHAWYANGKMRSERNFSASKLQAISIASRPTNPKLSFYNLNTAATKNGVSLSQALSAAHAFKTVNAIDDRYEPPFKQCLPHGLLADYYTNGKLRDTGFYQEGLRDGLWMHRDKSGRLLQSGYYQQGLRYGPWKEYNREAQLLVLSEYQHGRLINQKKYDPLAAADFPAVAEE